MAVPETETTVEAVEPAAEYDEPALRALASALSSNPAVAEAFREARDGLMRRAFTTELGEAAKREHLYLLAQSCRELEAVIGRMAAKGRHSAEAAKRLHS